MEHVEFIEIVYMAIYIKTMCPLRVRNCNDGSGRNCVSTYIGHTLNSWSFGEAV